MKRKKKNPFNTPEYRAWQAQADENLRNLRARIEQVDVLDQTCERPDGLDLQAEWDRLRSGLDRRTERH